MYFKKNLSFSLSLIEFFFLLFVGDRCKEYGGMKRNLFRCLPLRKEKEKKRLTEEEKKNKLEQTRE